MILERTLHKSYRALAKSRRVVAATALLRNQLDHVVRYHFSGTFDTCELAENLLLRTIGHRIHRFIDVGANVGRFAQKVFAQAPPDCAGLLLEPSASALAALRTRFSTNSRATLLAVAAAEREGRARFFEELEAGESSTLVAGASTGRGRWREVELRSLDSIVRQHGWKAIDLIKIDAEGYDLRVLEGMVELLERRAASIVQFEYNTSWRAAGALLQTAASMLSAVDYQLFLLRDDGLCRPNLERFGEYFAYSNYVAVRADDVAQIEPLIRQPY